MYFPDPDFFFHLAKNPAIVYQNYYPCLLFCQFFISDLFSLDRKANFFVQYLKL